MNIWKVSHGNYFFSYEENEDLFNRRCVCVHPETSSKGRSSTTQGENFANVAVGDYFYLCFSNYRIRLFGRFTGRKHECKLEGKDGWLEQEYDLLFESIKEGAYYGEKYWWTPNDNSTFIKVSDNKKFEEFILKPFFGKTLSDIDNTLSMEKNACSFVAEQSKVSAEIKTVNQLLQMKNLTIPNYQRPYRWTEKNVRQLLEDIFESMNSGKKSYRIGSLILHKEGTNYNVVDGQQRLTTLCLLQMACDEVDSERLNASNSLHYYHADSVNHIIANYTSIVNWFDKEYGFNSKKNYWEYVLNSCDFVEIVVTDLSEAFQMFDSQNGRGKELEPYNLLKAYHIRAMEQDDREDKIRSDQQWEAATQYDPTPRISDDSNIDILQQLFSEQLYRSRMWSRNNEAYEFSKKKIEEFKGFTIDKNHPAIFPFQNPQLLQYLTAKFYKNVLSGTVATQNRFEYGDNEKIDPFVNINQHIVNGKPFFDYIQTYVEIYKQMFIEMGTYQLSDFKEFFYKYCLRYGDESANRKNDYSFQPRYPATRTGDTYLRECYKSLVFVLFDKFGEKGLNRYYKTLYRLIYLERVTKSPVKYNGVAKLPGKYFKIIIEAKDLSDLEELNRCLSDSINNMKPVVKVNGIEAIKDFIINGDKD